MLNNHLIPILTVALTTLLLTACGGGGGNGGGVTASDTQQKSSSPTTQTSSSAQVSSSSLLPSLDRVNTPVIAGAYLDLLSFAKETAVTIVNGEYQTGLADGTYKDSCEGGGGSFDITVSNNGNRLIQKYDNCLLSITEGGKTDTLLLSGEESIISTHNENGLSVVNIIWKNYTVKNNGEPPLAIDGSFIYEGLLYFNSQITYKNVTARIKINAKVNNGSETLDAKNVDFVFDYPAIFDLYEGAGFGYASKPDMLHIFTQKIATAKGSLWINGVGANFSLNTIDQKVTFSNEGIAKGYLDGEPKGFFIQWDKNNDALIDAGIFLTETEYSAILDQTDAENNSIYYTRYLSDYGTPYPKNHWPTGRYQPVALSRGATTEIDARELFTSKSGALLTYEINNESFSEDWEQIEAGRFLLKFPDSNGTEIFKLNITAIDINGNRSPVIEANVRMNDNLADFDKDGIPDYKDSDVDNDGIPNYSDRFPKDPYEHEDTDSDGIGDNADTDMDGDSVINANDTHPKDTSCNKFSEGDSFGCFLTRARYSFTDKYQVAHFTQERYENDVSSMRFVRFDMNSKRFLPPTDFIEFTRGWVDGASYNAESHSVLARFASEGLLYIIQLNNNSLKLLRKDEYESSSTRFSEFGYFIIGVSLDNSNTYWLEVYDSNGVMTDSSKADALSNIRREIPFNLQQSAAVPFCEYSVSINTQGKLIETGDYTKRYDDNCLGQVALSANKQFGFSTTGLLTPIPIFNNERKKMIEINYTNPQWLQNNIMYHIWNTNDLVIINPTTQIESRFPNANVGAGVVGNEIITIETTSEPFAWYLKIYDENLQLTYSSKNN